MFNKKPKEEKPVEQAQDVEREEEVVERTCPNAVTALTIIRDVLRDYVFCLCNISKQHKADIHACVEYLINYIKEHGELDSIIDSIDDNSLIQLSKTFERNGYTIDININKMEE